MSDKNKDLCLALMHAETEDEIIEVLDAEGYWTDAAAWRPLGDRENNYGTAGNQQEDAVGALVEKAVNAIDARLMGECRVREIDPEGPHAPKSSREAVAWFFDDAVPDDTLGRKGLISEWVGTSKMTSEARQITITANGPTKKPTTRLSITIADSGEGQTPDEFPNTLMSLGESNKLRVPFVQGKFNMGGTGALPFCSPEHNFQLVVSRRRPELVGSDASPRCDQWGFTVVRRVRPDGKRRLSSYQYLAPIRDDVSDGEYGRVLAFAAESMPIFPEESPSGKARANPYGRSSTCGTLVKLYDFQLRNDRAAITGTPGVLRRLEVALPRAILPMLLVDARYERNSGTNAYGVQSRLERVADAKESLEPGFPIHGNIPVKDHVVRVDVYAFKQGRSTTYRPGAQRSIAYVINGQGHAFDGDTYFSRGNVDFGYLAKQRSLFVVVDCSELDDLYGEDLFLPSRDRKRDNDVNSELQAALQDFLKTSPELQALNQARRAAVVREKLDQGTATASVVSSVLQKFPRILDFLTRGRKIGPVVVPEEVSDEPFEGRHFPTYFELVSPKVRGDGFAHTEVTRSGRLHLEFLTDAKSDYFTRSDLPGRLQVADAEAGIDVTRAFSSAGPTDGRFRMWCNAVAADKAVGDQMTLEIVVDDENDFGRGELKSRVHLIVKKDPSPPGGKKKKKKGRNRPSRDVPQPTRVWSDDSSPRFRKGDSTWAEMAENEFEFNETTGVEVVPNGEAGFDYFINMDNLHAEHARVAADDADIADARWESVMHVAALSLVASVARDGDKKGRRSPESLVREATAGLAPVAIALGAIFEEEPPTL